MTQSIGFVTAKAPGGGYQLSRITSLEDGHLHADVVAYRTTLPEIQGIEHALKQQIFGEVAWHTLAPQSLPPMPPMPQAPQEPQPGMEELPQGMPSVMQTYEQEGGLVGRLLRNGVARALMPALFLSCLWIEVNLSRLT